MSWNKNILKNLSFALAISLSSVSAATITNPIIHADVPDIAMVQVDGTYYMVSTTMHVNPGVPIMASKDLVNWKIISYCYSTIANTDEMNLNNGKNAYGQGSWASSIRYKNGTFYVLTPGKSSGKTHLFSATNPAGPWKEVTFGFYHDPSLVLDDDGKNYIVSGGGNINVVELKEDLSGIKAGGVNKVLISNATAASGSTSGLNAEGSQVIKYNGYYYVFTICWPSGSMRTVLVHRSSTFLGTYTGKVALKSSGVAQGSVIQAPDGKWFGYLFQDNGSVGRSPWIMPVTWTDGWPVFNNGTAPTSITMDATPPVDGFGIVTSDDFTATKLPLEWQWNHNPVNTAWSLTANPGFMRITTSRVDADFLNTRNSLTQRAYGPKSSGQVALETKGMKDGDFAGLGALQKGYGLVGVKMNGTTKTIVMVNGSSGTAQQVATAALNQDRVYLRVDMDFTNRTDKATFYYSLNGTSWTALGNTLQMTYSIPHFMGYRFALFNQATKATGGYADFDFFKVGKNSTTLIPFPTGSSTSSSSAGTPSSSAAAAPQGPYSTMAKIPGTIQMEHYDVGGEDVAYHDDDVANSGNMFRTDGVDITGDATLGYKIGYTVAGEWLEYTVNVEKPGKYKWEAQVSAGGDGSAFHALLGATNITGAVTVPNTTSWDTYQIVSGTTPELTVGQQVLRIEVDGSYFNFDWIKFTEETPSSLRQGVKQDLVNRVGITRYDLLGRKHKSTEVIGR